MPSFTTMQRIYGEPKTIGQQLKCISDDIMEQTWDSNIQSRVCYLYDYFHDDTPSLNEGMTYKNTTKTRVNAKFIISSYGSIDKDQVAYHLQFMPNQKTHFSPNDELYYYETEFREKYSATFPIGLYVDIPDDEEIYHRWIICSKEIGNQFIKYNVLPCDYRLHWIDIKGNKHIKRKMWGTTRDQKSYNSGLWRDFLSQSTENQEKIWLPMNSITENLYYVYFDNKTVNQRVVMSAPIREPITWQISKVENASPFGLQKLTLAQDKWNPDTDEICVGYPDEEKDNRFAMYANYKLQIIPPTNDDMVENVSTYHCDISCNSNKIKIGGSYKLLTVTIFDNLNQDVTSEFISNLTTAQWSCVLNGQDITSSDLIKWLSQSEPNKIKIKFADNRSYLTNILNIKCTLNINGVEIIGEIQLEISAL